MRDREPPAAATPRSAPRHRGVIEGFYGTPYTHAERLDLLRFLGAEGLNVYVHAPKNDPLHRDEWRTPYSPARLREFEELATLGATLGVRVIAALAPGPSWREADPADPRHLEEKLHALHECGAGGLAILFDDLVDPTVDAVDPEIQARIAGRAWKLASSLRPAPELWIVGNVYAGDPEDLRCGRGIFAQLYPHPAERYFAAYARHLPAEVPLLWTGPGVFAARVPGSHVAAVREMAGRPIVLWDNFPVNDAFPNALALGPYRGRGADLLAELHGLVLNLGQQPRASRLPVATAAAWLRDPEGYDPELAWRDAAARLAGERAAGAFTRFAEQSTGHPVLEGADGAAELGRLVEAALPAAAPTRIDRQALEGLRELLRGLEELPAVLELQLEDRALLAEIEPWARRLGDLSSAALAALDALTAGGDPARALLCRQRADAHGPLQVAAAHLPPGLAPFVSGAGRSVDRFADLFAAVEVRQRGR